MATLAEVPAARTGLGGAWSHRDHLEGADPPRTPAGTSVRFPRGRTACAAWRPVRWRAARAVGYVGGVRAIRSRRSRSFTRGRALWHSASVCSAAICTARTVRTGSRRRRFVIRRRSLPARRRSQDAGRGSRAARRARGRQHLQRAADYERMGRRDFRYARDAGLMTAYVSNGNGTQRAELRPWIDLQGRSQELRRQALSSARRPARTHSPNDSGAARDGDLGGDRPLLIPASTTPRKSSAAHGVPGRRFSRHPVARHCLPQGLPHERPGEHYAGDADGGGRHRQAERSAVCLCRQPLRDASAISSIPLPQLRNASSSAMAISSRAIG